MSPRLMAIGLLWWPIVMTGMTLVPSICCSDSSGSGTVSAGFAQSARAHHVGIAVSGDLDEAEVTDLEKLFEKVSSIFRGFVQGRDDEAQTQTLQLAEGFHELEDLSSLDLSVEIIRSVTLVSASGQTPGGAPGTAVAIPQSSNGTTAPTPSPNLPAPRVSRY